MITLIIFIEKNNFMDNNFDRDQILLSLIDQNLMIKKGIICIFKPIIINLNNNKINNFQIGLAFTLYGEKIENNLKFLLDPKTRAIDYANISFNMQNFYKILLNKVEEKNFLFNQLIFTEKSLMTHDIISKLRKIKDNKIFLELIRKKPDEYFISELDCIVTFNIKFEKYSKNIKDRLFFETKLFTIPLDPKKELATLSEHLSSTNLFEYLKNRGLDYYVMMTVSYLHYLNSETLPLNKIKGKYPFNLPSCWAAHLIFINNKVLDYLKYYKFKNKIQKLSKSIIDLIKEEQLELLEILKNKYKIKKNIKFRITYNIIKVVMMYQIISEMEKIIEEKEEILKEKEEKLKEKEEKLKEKDEELKEKDKELKEKDKIIEFLKRQLKEKDEFIKKLTEKFNNENSNK